MRLLVDEHYSSALAEQLRLHGHDVAAITERLEWRELADPDVLDIAKDNRRVLVTENARHFLPLHAQTLGEGRSHHGIIVASPRRFPRSDRGLGKLARALGALLVAHPRDDELRGDLVWLQEGG